MWIKLLLLLFVFSFLFRTDLSFDQDLGRHIKLGEIITQTHQIPKTNLFSYTNPNFPFINTHWLFEVWAYVLSQFPGGVEGLLVRKVIIFLFSVFLILKIVPKQNSALLLPIGFIFLHVLRERLELRPEIFSFLFTATTLFILERFTSPSSSRATEGSVAISFFNRLLRRFTPRNDVLIYLLPLIQLIWINTHIYFFVGLMLQVIYLIHISYKYLRFHLEGVKLKLLCIIFGLSVLASLLNPNGLSGLLYPLNVSKNYGYTIVENQTMFFLESISFRDPNFLFVKISLVIIVLGLLTAILRKSFELKNILLAVFGVSLAILNVRGFPYLFFISFAPTLQNLGSINSKTLTQILTTSTLILLILESFFYLNGDYYKYTLSEHQAGLKTVSSVSRAMDFVLANDLPSPIFNNFDIGSYILYRGYPKHESSNPSGYRVFVDGRPEAYPKDFFQKTYIPMQYDYQKFKSEEVKWGFKTVIFSHTDQTPWGKNFLRNITGDPTWKTVYIDDFMIVLIKDAVLADKKMTEVDLSKLSPDSYNFSSYLSYLRLGYFMLNLGYTDPYIQFVQKSTRVFPIFNSNNYFFW